MLTEHIVSKWLLVGTRIRFWLPIYKQYFWGELLKSDSDCSSYIKNVQDPFPDTQCKKHRHFYSVKIND